MIQKSSSAYAIWINLSALPPWCADGVLMISLWTAAVVLFLSALGTWVWSAQRFERERRRGELRRGSIVLVRTPDHKQLVARVISRGPSHFWIEIEPGDTRWWVPETAVDPAPMPVVRRWLAFRQELPLPERKG